MRRLVSCLVTLGAMLGASLAVVPPTTAAFPGDDGRIAFVRSNQIYTVRPDGSGLDQLTFRGNNYRPKYGPQGARIAYLHETTDGAKDIWVMRADGTHKRQVTDSGTVSTAPSWSPDGAWLVFGSPLQKVKATPPFGQPQRLLGDLDGDGVEVPLRVEGSVAWSPDGERIAYYSDQFPSSPDNYILMYDVASHDVSVWLVIGGDCCGEGYFSDLAWSASGTHLGFTDGYYSPEVTPEQPRPVVSIQTYPGGRFIDYASRRGDKQPAFSPSGNYVALVTGSGGAPEIYVTDFDGSDRHLLTSGYHPDWQPRP